MVPDTLMLLQLLSIVLAGFGTPGLTFWVMKKMSREALNQIINHCELHRSHMNNKIGKIDTTLNEAIHRQIELREKLPVYYVRKEDYLRHVNGKKTL